jgi:hypothetical protein
LSHARARRGAQIVCVTVAALAAVTFLIYFDQSRAQIWVDSLWLLALVLWTRAVFLQPSTARPTAVLRVADLWPLAVVVPLFALCWLPFHDNWRWAYTGDSFGIYGAGTWLGVKGARVSLLSVHGVDDFYTYLWEVSYNWPMYFFGPSLFWHRVGQLIMACLALTAIYAFFCIILGRLWATAIVLATATNYVWIWISYISYQRTDSFVFYYLTLIWGVLLWRTPEHHAIWALAGLTGGLSLFYTPVTWGAVAAVAIVFGMRALARGALAGPLVYAVSFLLATIPILTELPWMMEMLRTQSFARGAEQQSLLPTPSYLWSTFRTIVLSAYDSPIYILGVCGAFLRWPLGHLYLAGAAIAALGAVPALRRRLRLPVAAPLLLALFLCDALLFSLTNKGYWAPSHKRFYNLIPLQVFFALLPLWVAHAWSAARPRLRALVVVLLAAAITTSAANGMRIIIDPRPLMYGYNIFDGLIEIHQRFPQRDVVLFSTRPHEALARGESFDRVYGVAERLSLLPEVSAQTLDQACRSRALFCYEVNVVQDQATALLEPDSRWVPFPLLNANEIKCYDCTG